VTRRDRREASGALVDVCRGRRPNRPSDRDVEADLMAGARFHRIAPLVHVAYRSSAPRLAVSLKVDRDRAIGGHLRACAALGRLDAALSGMKWLTFKGAVLSESAHPVPGLRTYHDVDVLVAPSDLREVCGRLRDVGWRVADYRDMLQNPKTPGEMHWITPDGVIIDLHWAMINMADRRRRFRVPTAHLLDRRVVTLLGSQQVCTLDPTDALVHACLHAALAGGNRLLWLLDIDQLSRQSTDWTAVAARARAWRAQAQVWLMLDRAARFLGTPRPADLARQLAISRTLRVATGAADLLSPVPRARQEAGPARFVAHAVGPTAAASVRAAGRHGLSAIRDRLPATPAQAPIREPADAESLASYLAAVESPTTDAGGVGGSATAALVAEPRKVTAAGRQSTDDARQRRGPREDRDRGQ
jgi:hypothetical protein